VYLSFDSKTVEVSELLIVIKSFSHNGLIWPRASILFGKENVHFENKEALSQALPTILPVPINVKNTVVRTKKYTVNKTEVFRLPF
jgi:hypothetical protein